MISNFEIEEIANNYNINVVVVMKDELKMYTLPPMKSILQYVSICNPQILGTVLIG